MNRAFEKARNKILEAAETGATDLGLHDRELIELPAEIGQLSSLRTLNLMETQLSELPAEIGQLSSLQTLDLTNSHVSELPAEIRQLSSLQKLYLQGTQLSELPVEICQLSSLQTLSLSDTQFTELPAEIGQLSSLQTLYLNDLELSELPSEIGQLSSLQRLYLRNTQVSSLPAEIGQLSSLQTLDLRNTQVSELPVEIGQLSSLQTLDLNDTPLTSLPPELGSLDDHLDLGLDNTQLPEPFPELIERGTLAVLAYLRSLADGAPQYEAKVLLVGEGNVGKTSLVAAMCAQPFVENRPTTHGIQLDQLSVPHPELEQAITLNTWDFGGQEVYRVTHQFFFSRRSLYLLVWRAREGQEENAVEGWLERIRLRVGGDVRVMIVATHCDERRPELDYPELQERFGDILVGNHEVDNKSGTGVLRLAQAVARAAAELPQMGQKMSHRWTAARDAILGLAEPQVERRLVDEICAEKGLDDREAETLIDLLHDLGHIVYFGDDDGLRNVVVRQPEWLTKAIGYVLEDGRTRDARGELDHARLQEIWCQHGGPEADRYPPHYHPYFLRLMEKFDICFRIPDREQSLVGQLVPHERPKLPWLRGQTPAEEQRELALIGELSNEAPGLVSWLTVRNHRFSTGQNWRRGVFFAHRSYASEALLELVGRRHLHLNVRAPSPDYFFSILRDSIEELIELRWEGLRCEFLVPCPRALDGDAPCEGRFNFRKLLHRREHGRTTVECDECFEEFDIQRLLTGFPQAGGSIDQQLDRLGQLVERVDRRTEHMEQTAAEAADGVRATLNFLSQEVTDCPRLFMLAPKDKRRWSPARVWESDYALTLCCEHPGHEHAWADAIYEISQSRAWLERAGPYISIVSKTLRVAVPIAGALAGTMMDDVTRKDLADEMKLMDRIVGALPGGIEIDREAVEASEQLTRAQGDGLRALRQLLLELDRPRAFGGMRRVVTPSGDVLWVCPEHYGEYDPGLPVLPYDTTEA